MIRRRFSVFRGIGRKTEQVIWNAGVPDWQSFIDAGSVETLTPKKYDRLRPQVDEFEAVRLWHRYKRAGDETALEKLVEYNQADTSNLAEIAPVIYEGLCRKVGL